MPSAIETAGIESISHVTLVVPDQAEALEWYTETFGFEVRADEPFETPEGAEGRWITVGVPGQDGLEITLLSPDPALYPPEAVESYESWIGRLPPLVLSTGDCRETVAELESRGVTVTEEPVEYPWGTSAMIADPWGNEFNVMESLA